MQLSDEKKESLCVTALKYTNDDFNNVKTNLIKIFDKIDADEALYKALNWISNKHDLCNDDDQRDKMGMATYKIIKFINLYVKTEFPLVKAWSTDTSKLKLAFQEFKNELQEICNKEDSASKVVVDCDDPDDTSLQPIKKVDTEIKFIFLNDKDTFFDGDIFNDALETQLEKSIATIDTYRNKNCTAKTNTNEQFKALKQSVFKLLVSRIYSFFLEPKEAKNTVDIEQFKNPETKVVWECNLFKFLSLFSTPKQFSANLHQEHIFDQEYTIKLIAEDMCQVFEIYLKDE